MSTAIYGKDSIIRNGTEGEARRGNGTRKRGGGESP